MKQSQNDLENNNWQHISFSNDEYEFDCYFWLEDINKSYGIADFQNKYIIHFKVGKKEWDYVPISPLELCLIEEWEKDHTNQDTIDYFYALYRVEKDGPDWQWIEMKKKKSSKRLKNSSENVIINNKDEKDKEAVTDAEMALSLEDYVTQYNLEIEI